MSHRLLYNVSVREKGATEMTFTIINAYTGESYTLDIDTLDDLLSLADGYGTLKIDVQNLTVTIG